MADRLQSWIGFVRKAIKRHWDMVIVVDGMEGAGKSTLALHMKALYDGRYNLDHVLFDSKDLLDKMESAPSGSCIILDEAITSLYKRESLKEFQTRLVQAFSIIRARELFFILVLPNYWDLDSSLRTRARYRFYVHAKRLSRGFVKVYLQKRNEWVAGRPWQELIWQYRFPDLTDSFRHRYHVFKMEQISLKLKEYQHEAEVEAEKQEQKAREIKGPKMRMIVEAYEKDPTRDVVEVAREVGCTVKYVREASAPYRQESEA